MRPLLRPLARRAAATLAAAALGLNAGCYSYRPLAPGAPAPGASLRVTLSERGAAELTRFLGPRATTLEGRLVAGSDSAVTMAVTSITRTTGAEESWPGDQVVIPRAALASAETRRFAATRSLLLAAAIVAAGALIGAAIQSGEDIDRTGTGPGNPGRQ